MARQSFPRRLSILVLLAVAGMACACRTEAQAEARLRAEVNRLEGVLKRLDAASPPGKGSSAVAGLRDQLAKIRRTDSPSVLAYQLREPFVGVERLAFLLDHREAAKDLTRVEALWAERKQRFAAPASRPVADTPPLFAALAQGAANRGEKLYQAALAYAKVTSPPSGLYYLGEAEGEMGFHDFVSSLSLPAGKEKAPDAAALQAAQEGLEAEMMQVFANDPAAPAMIPVSARLKEARELLERGSREAAALTLLDSRLALSRRRGTKAATPHTEPAAGAPAEGSLIAPFLAMAAAEGPGSATAQIVRSEVVPLYRSFFRSTP
jgi:hypothetical protein